MKFRVRRKVTHLKPARAPETCNTDQPCTLSDIKKILRAPVALGGGRPEQWSTQNFIWKGG